MNDKDHEHRPLAKLPKDFVYDLGIMEKL